MKPSFPSFTSALSPWLTDSKAQISFTLTLLADSVRWTIHVNVGSHIFGKSSIKPWWCQREQQSTHLLRESDRMSNYQCKSFRVPLSLSAVAIIHRVQNFFSFGNTELVSPFGGALLDGHFLKFAIDSCFALLFGFIHRR